jgi:hypothetical protein
MLVAETFLEDPEKNSILVHLDGNQIIILLGILNG